MTEPTYRARQLRHPPELSGNWNSPVWRDVPGLSVDQFHPHSTGHRPLTRAKLGFDARHLYLLFDVQDRYVRSVQTEPQSAVCTDSCVEFFVQPRPDRGYFNFEINAGGVMLLHYYRVPRVDFTPLPADALQQIRVYHSLPGPVEQEIVMPVHWQVELAIPVAIMEPYVGPIALPESGWRANFYKCADATSHPHWASWSPVGEKLDFHQPATFGRIEFEET